MPAIQTPQSANQIKLADNSLKSVKRKWLAVAITLASAGFVGSAMAGPEGGTVVGGGGTISQTDLTTTIQQNTNRMAIDWQSFNVAADERVQFIQPDAQSIVLNNILGNSGSLIQGQIDANGHVVLVNPNGVFFTETSTVNVGGLIASGLHINTDDFMNGDLLFSAMENSEGKVVNQGVIAASLGGRYSH